MKRSDSRIFGDDVLLAAPFSRRIGKAPLPALLLLLVTVCNSGAGSHLPPKIPIENFFGNPPRCAFRISPDGKMLSFLQEWQGHLNVFIQPINGLTSHQVTFETETDIQRPLRKSAQFDDPKPIASEIDVPTDYFWKNNRYIVFRKDTNGDEHFHFYRVDVTKAGSSATVENLTPFKNTCAELIDDLEGVSETDILIKLNKNEPKILEACRINVVNPDPKSIGTAAKNDFGALDWIADHSGVVRGAITRNGTKTTLRTRPDANSKFKPVLTTEFTDSIQLQGFTPDNKSLYAISKVGRDKAALVLIDPDTGKEIGSPIWKRDDVDLDQLEFSKSRKIPVFVSYSTTKLQRKFFDDKTKGIFQTLSRKFPGYLIYLTSHDRNEEKFIVAVLGDRSPGRRYLFDSRTDALQKLVDIAPGLKEEDLAKTKAIKYRNDGLTIHGYLTLPLGRGKKNLPTVVLPHGGPWARDTWIYTPDVQFLANRGYAVLQVNFRGSTGYGKKFWEDGFKQWGGKMQDDVTAGVKWLISRGIADPKRIAIYGESYGGYAAMAGVTFTPDLYKAAADRAGITNLVDFLEPMPAQAPYWRPLLPELYVKVGDPKNEQDHKMLAARSPLLQFNQIKVPVLISHGGNDIHVNIDQSKRMAAQLDHNGLHPVSLWFENEGHVFGSQASLSFHKKLEAFLENELHPNGHPD